MTLGDLKQILEEIPEKYDDLQLQSNYLIAVKEIDFYIMDYLGHEYIEIQITKFP